MVMVVVFQPALFEVAEQGRVVGSGTDSLVITAA